MERVPRMGMVSGEQVGSDAADRHVVRARAARGEAMASGDRRVPPRGLKRGFRPARADRHTSSG